MVLHITDQASGFTILRNSGFSTVLIEIISLAIKCITDSVIPFHCLPPFVYDFILSITSPRVICIPLLWLSSLFTAVISFFFHFSIEARSFMWWIFKWLYKLLVFAPRTNIPVQHRQQITESLSSSLSFYPEEFPNQSISVFFVTNYSIAQFCS